MELEKAILTRRSTRKFLDTPVPEDVIVKMLEMARLAPSGGNGQTHLFGVIRDAETRRALAECAGRQMWIADAPLVIACCARLEPDFSSLPEDDFGYAVNRLRWGRAFCGHLTAYPDWRAPGALLANAAPLIPMEHMFLTAVSYGLSACIVGWLDVEGASALLRLPPDVKCLFLLPVGYPAEPPAPIQKKEIAEISFRDGPPRCD